MKRNGIAALLLCFAIFLVSCDTEPTGPPSSGTVPGGETTADPAGNETTTENNKGTDDLEPLNNDIKIMAYNMSGNGATAQHDAEVTQILTYYDADIIILNETSDAYYQNAPSLSSDYGKTRNIFPVDNDTGNLLLFKKEKFELVEDALYCLSSTPEKWSKVSESYHYRTMLVAKLRVKENGREFYVIGTHLENNSTNSEIFEKRDTARKFQGLYMLSIIENHLDTSLPMIIAGDLNATDDTSVAYRNGGISELLADGLFENSTSIAADAETEKKSHSSGVSFDHILFGTGKFTVSKFSVFRALPVAGNPSDHYPIMSVFKFAD